MRARKSRGFRRYWRESLSFNLRLSPPYSIYTLIIAICTTRAVACSPLLAYQPIKRREHALVARRDAHSPVTTGFESHAQTGATWHYGCARATQVQKLKRWTPTQIAHVDEIDALAGVHNPQMSACDEWGNVRELSAKRKIERCQPWAI